MTAEGARPRLPPLPVWDADSEGFWVGTRNHQLMVQRCHDCGYATFPPLPLCRNCCSFHLVWVESNGRGRIYSWTTVFRSTRVEFADDVPYTLAIVELDDFPVRIPARLLGVEPLEAKIGASVRVGFDDLTDEVTLPYWVLDN